MLKPFAVLIFASAFLYSFAQNKYDANWCFGSRAGINFSDTSNPVVYKTRSYCEEASGSISSVNGNLLFYISNPLPFSSTNKYYDLLDSNGIKVENGDSVEMSFTATNGALILNTSVGDDRFYLFQIAPGNSSCWPSPANSICHNLLYSIIEIDDMGHLRVITKNKVLMEDVEERLAAVKGVNGRNWWVLANARYVNGSRCQSRFYRFLLNDNGIIDTFFQDIGTLHCDEYAYVGEMKFSYQGDKLASVIYGQQQVDLFDFDRCTGILSNYRTINQNFPSSFPYGCEFSQNGNFLYVSFDPTNYSSKLYQYSIKDTALTGIEIWSNNNVIVGQVERGADSKIYVCCYYPFGFEQQNLGVINSPDSAGFACNFQPFSFFLGDSAFARSGLPNMPNYNLGPIGIYQAKAALQDILTICIDSIVTLGALPVEHLIYSWSPSMGISDTTIAQPTASPINDTWYYLTVTDTTALTSCSSRVDSVFVGVINSCSTSLLTGVQSVGFNFYPNPTNEILHISLSNMNNLAKRITITDVNGKEAIHSVETIIDVSSLPQGLYFLNVQLENGESGVRKIVVQ